MKTILASAATALFVATLSAGAQAAPASGFGVQPATPLVEAAMMKKKMMRKRKGMMMKKKMM